MLFLLACSGPSPAPPAPEARQAPRQSVCDWAADAKMTVRDQDVFGPFLFISQFSSEGTGGWISFATPKQRHNRTVETWRELRRVGEGPWRSVTVDIPGLVTQMGAGCASAPSTTGVVAHGVLPKGRAGMAELVARRAADDGLTVTLPSRSRLPDAWMSVGAYAAPDGAVRVTGDGDAGGAFPSRLWLGGACRRAEVDVADFEQVTLTGAPGAFALANRGGTVWVRLTPGAALREASAVRSDKAAWVELPVDTDAVVTMQGEWRVLCANTTRAECEQPRASRLTLGRGGPELRLSAPRGRLLLYDEPASVSDPLSDCSPDWHAPAIGQAFLGKLATGPLNEPCGDFADERCWDVSGFR